MFAGLAGVAWGETPSLKDMPAPPSVAINPAPLDAAADIKVMVDAIPASAKYVVHVKLGAKGNQLKPEEAADTGANLSQVCEQMQQFARTRGANLVVILGAEHGIEVPIKQTSQLLKLRPNDPSLAMILFRWDNPAPLTAAETHLRFTTQPPPAHTENMNYKINLQAAPPGLEMATWLYGNIARFVNDATHHGFNTVSLRSTRDAKFENVWLPGCDEPVRVSLLKPELDVTIFKSAMAN